MHLNFDEALDPVAVEADVLATSDRADPIPLRRHARLWLADDYADQKVRIAAKARASAAAAAVLVGLQAEIAGAYAEQQARDDVENADHPTPTQRLPERGMLTRRDYTLYAHFAYLRALCPKVGKWRFFLDQDPGMRAACLATFVQEVKAKTCDAWYVRISKGLTMGKKRKLTETARKAFVAAKLRMPAGTTDHQVVVALIRAKMAAMVPMGRWHDKWLDHPMPNMSEPEKAAAWLTEDPALDPDHAASLYNLASLHGADSLFNRVRRRVSLLERSPVTSSGRVWTAYAPYVPEQAARLIEIVRVCHNFVWTDDKGTTTPAMRLGLAKGPVGFDDILRFVP